MRKGSVARRACRTAVGVDAATARMAPVFGGRMETKVETPNIPRLEMVKVPRGGTRRGRHQGTGRREGTEAGEASVTGWEGVAGWRHRGRLRTCQLEMVNIPAQRG
jgi:hypothetical protein